MPAPIYWDGIHRWPPVHPGRHCLYSPSLQRRALILFICTAVGVGGKAVALNEAVRIQKSRVHVNLFAGSRIKKRMG